MAPTAKRQLVEARLGQSLASFVSERHKAYYRGKGWRTVAAEIRERTGIDVSHETLRAWFADEADGSAA